MSNETTSQPTSWSWGNTTEEYCLKVPMAAEANLCDWPYAPPFCEVTWPKYVGESVFNVSKFFFLSLFVPYLVVHIRLQYWSFLRLQIKKKGYWDKTGNEWMPFYLIIFTTIRVFQEIDYGSILGIWSPHKMDVCGY